MKCKNCKSERIASVLANCEDTFQLEYLNQYYDGYVPEGIGLGDNEEGPEFKYCLNCGTIQGEFPIDEATILKAWEDNDEDEDEDHDPDDYEDNDEER